LGGMLSGRNASVTLGLASTAWITQRAIAQSGLVSGPQHHPWRFVRFECFPPT
jgi:hypothetical protein